MTRLTDRPALIRNRARAACDPVLFLHETVADEVQERLHDVNRSFHNPAIVTGWPAPWSAEFPTAKLVADTDVLSLEERAHDLVIHGLSLHWADDPVGQLVQCLHGLRPDGLMIATLFGGETLHELRAALATAESRITGGLSPRVLPMGELRDLGGLLQRAGFALPVADSARYTVTYETPFALMHDLRRMGEGNALAGRLRRPTSRAVLTEAARIYAEEHGRPDGRIPATFEVITLTGWAPDPTQPQPLKRGSATHRLDDILKQLRDDAED